MLNALKYFKFSTQIFLGRLSQHQTLLKFITLFSGASTTSTCHDIFQSEKIKTTIDRELNIALFLSRNAVLIMKRFCRDSPAERLGYQKDGIMDIKKHKWFQGFDWDGLLDRSLAPPLVPSVQSTSDASNFDQVGLDV